MFEAFLVDLVTNNLLSLPLFVTLDPEKRRFTIFSTFIDGKILIGNIYQIRVVAY